MRKKIGLILLCLLLILPGSTAGGVPGPLETDTYVVVFQAETLPDDYGTIIAQAGGRVISANNSIGTALVQGTGSGFQKKVRQNGAVAEAGPAGYVTADIVGMMPADEDSSAAADSFYDLYQWDIKRVGGNPDTWAVEEGNHSVVIAVIDSGVDKTHPDINANYLYGKSLLPEFPDGGEDLLGHGTFVAGQIAGNGMIKGVGPGLGIASYRVFGSEDLTYISVVGQALVMAADDGAQIINLSLGCLIDQADAEMRAQYQEFQRAVKYAEAKGAVIVTSSGNEALNLDKAGRIKSLPGDMPGVITVSATNNLDQLAFYANYGNSIIDCCAPGGDLGLDYNPDDMSTADLSCTCFGIVPGGYGYAVGTSMAAPKVSALIGLLKAHYPDLTMKKVLKLLEYSTEQLGKKLYFGDGLINAQLAFD